MSDLFASTQRQAKLSAHSGQSGGLACERGFVRARPDPAGPRGLANQYCSAVSSGETDGVDLDGSARPEGADPHDIAKISCPGEASEMLAERVLPSGTHEVVERRLQHRQDRRAQASVDLDPVRIDDAEPSQKAKQLSATRYTTRRDLEGSSVTGTTRSMSRSSAGFSSTVAS